LKRRAKGVRLSIEAELDYHFPEAVDVLLAVEVAQIGRASCRERV